MLTVILGFEFELNITIRIFVPIKALGYGRGVLIVNTLVLKNTRGPSF